MGSLRSFRNTSRRIRSPAICFAFRGRNASRLKILFWDGNGLCLFTKRIDQGGFIWPRMGDPGGTVTLSPAQPAMLIEGIDWRTPERRWRPV
jgi:transposase